MELTLTTILLLSLAVITAHTAETLLGFGSTLIALALGSFLFPIEKLMAVLVLLGMVQSSWLILRGRNVIHWRLLLTLILPAAGLGTIAGAYLRGVADERLLKLLLGGFVLSLSALELFFLFRKKEAAARTMANPIAAPLLFGGGIFHGLFATGGPLVVYVTSRRISDPGVFRATLAVLWITLNIGLVAQLTASGNINGSTLTASAILFPAAATGIWIGEHLRVNARTFQLLTYSLLCLAGVSLLVP